MKTKVLEAISLVIITSGLLVMAIGILGNIMLQLEWINVSGDIVMLAPIGFFIVFIGGVMSMAVSKDDALVSTSEVDNE